MWNAQARLCLYCLHAIKSVYRLSSESLSHKISHNLFKCLYFCCYVFVLKNKCLNYSETCLKRPLKKKSKNLFAKLIITECRSKVLQKVPILLTFIKLPFVVKISFFSIFEWFFKTGFSGFLTMRTIWSWTRENLTVACICIV